MPQRILVLLAHPAHRRSRANAALRDAAKAVEGVTLHDLYEAYPDFLIDVDHEQALLLRHDVIVFQHPVYWYSSPAILKEWQDLVLEHGFAYGRAGTALAGKALLVRGHRRRHRDRLWAGGAEPLLHRGIPPPLRADGAALPDALAAALHPARDASAGRRGAGAARRHLSRAARRAARRAGGGGASPHHQHAAGER